MEFVHRRIEEKVNFSNHTLVIPSVSNGNVGQLAVECLVHNFSVADHLDVISRGWLKSRDVLPLAGNTFLGKDKKSLIRINLEIFQDEKNKLLFLIQRAPVARDKEERFASSLLKWAKSKGIEHVLVLGGSATKGATMNRMMSAMCVNVTSRETENLGKIAKLETDWNKFSREMWIDRFPFSGLLRLFLCTAQSTKTQVSALVLPCVEGNNFIDGMRVAATVLHYLSNNGLQLAPPVSDDDDDDKKKIWTLQSPRTGSLGDQDRPLESSMY